ncbi:MAG: DUF2336 domain-containing protein [Alphaproteobacteria bacterium]
MALTARNETPRNGNFDDLLTLARDKTVAGRTALVSAVSDLYFEQPSGPGERETELMTGILDRLIHDVEMSVRRALAVRLADRDDAPRDLVVTLANDRIEVAHPILSRSNVLDDEELIRIIEQRAAEHQLAIAMRRSITATISDALVGAENEGVIKTLLENKNAEISQATMAYLVEQSRRIGAYQTPLLHREELGPVLAKRMYWWVSAALREHILNNYEIDSDELDGALRQTVREAVDESRQTARPDGGGQGVLADYFHRNGAITPRFLIQVLREGEIPLLETLFAKFTGLNPTLVKQVLYEPGGRGLAIACKAAEIEKSDFASIFLLSRQGRSGDKLVDPRELTTVLAFYDTLVPEGAAAIIARWRLDPDYLGAIRDLKDGLTK